MAVTYAVVLRFLNGWIRPKPAVGYSKANRSPILKLFLSRIEELRAPMGQ
jgi:hypothetical protein